MLLIFALSAQTHSTRLHPPPEGRGFTLRLDKDVHSKIKREKLNVITEILAITNKLKECKPKAKKDLEGVLHPHKTTEARLAHLYVDLFDNLGQTKCYTMAELMKLTQISRASLTWISNHNATIHPVKPVTNAF